MVENKSFLSSAGLQLVLHEAGGTPTSATQVSEALKQVFTKLAEVLSRVVGTNGFLALVLRSWKLAGCLPPIPEHLSHSSPWPELLEWLSEHLKKRPSDEALNASVELLKSFFELFAVFVGERVTWRLLHNAWPGVLPSEVLPQEKKK